MKPLRWLLLLPLGLAACERAPAPAPVLADAANVEALQGHVRAIAAPLWGEDWSQHVVVVPPGAGRSDAERLAGLLRGSEGSPIRIAVTGWEPAEIQRVVVDALAQIAGEPVRERELLVVADLESATPLVDAGRAAGVTVHVRASARFLPDDQPPER
jgi:hypothetical protein